MSIPLKQNQHFLRFYEKSPHQHFLRFYEKALDVAVVLAPSDNFSPFRFRVMAFFVASGPKNGHFRPFLPLEGCTLNFGPNLTKLGGIVRITKKNDQLWVCRRSGSELRRNDPFLRFAGKWKKRPKIRFLLKKLYKRGLDKGISLELLTID